jgi:hypothetical protein
MSNRDARFNRLFEPAEQELRRVLGGSVSSRTFYGCLAVVHSLAEQAARKS